MLTELHCQFCGARPPEAMEQAMLADVARTPGATGLEVTCGDCYRKRTGKEIEPNVPFRWYGRDSDIGPVALN